MTPYPHIDSDDLSAYFDAEAGIIYITYRGPITAALTIRAYQWTAELVAAVGEGRIRGSIVDFRKVTDFKSYSLSTVMRESQKLNVKLDLSHIPVALIVHSALQEQMARVALKVTPQDFRKRIVRSEAEAQAFIEARQHDPESPQ